MITTGIYEHYKGNRYKVLGIARHSETGEMMVVYQKLYDDHAWSVRPYEMFIEEVAVEGKKVPRFRFVEAV